MSDTAPYAAASVNRSKQLRLLTSGATIHIQIGGQVLCKAKAKPGSITRNHLFCGICLNEWERTV